MAQILKLRLEIILNIAQQISMLETLNNLAHIFRHSVRHIISPLASIIDQQQEVRWQSMR
jgi:hypothetical protein